MAFKCRFQIALLAISLLIPLQPALAYQVSGLVFGSTTPLTNAQITVIDNATQLAVATASTDNTGFYSVTVAEGAYRIEVSPQEPTIFVDSVIQNLVVENGNSVQNIVLLSSAGPAPVVPFNIWDPTSKWFHQNIIQDYSGNDIDNKILSFATIIPGKDSDGDGLLDLQETLDHLTSPLLTDSDGDGTSDPDEIEGGTDPTDAASFSKDIIWVDFASAVPPTGSLAAPFPTLTGGVNAVNAGGVIRIFAGESSEALVLSKPMTIGTVSGLARVGN
jgi:hypothetical protein